MHRATEALVFLLVFHATIALAPRAPAAAVSGPVGEPRSSRSSRSLGPGATTPMVEIQPLGDVDPTIARAVASRIERTFAVDVAVRPAKPLPASALHRPRMRFRGERVIDWLASARSSHAAATLGLMSRDLSATKGPIDDWGVMGIASPSRATGVISTHRLGRGRASAELLTARACQVAVHELGHSFGLLHCRARRCIMNDAEGSIASVDRSSGRFCGGCRKALDGLLRADGRVSGA